MRTTLLTLLRRAPLAAGAALVTGTVYASAEGADSWHKQLRFKSQFHGQLGPPVPTPAEAAAGATTCGEAVRCDGALAQRGPYGGLWLRVGSPGGPPPDAAALGATLDAAHGRSGAATYVAVAEACISPPLTEALCSRGFRFHHFRRPPPGAKAEVAAHNEYVYYRWEGDGAHDMVPAYATASEGVGGLILSADEQRVLLIWEYGCWKMVTGSVDAAESLLATLRREAREEVGVELDSTYRSKFLGGWHIGCYSDLQVWIPPTLVHSPPSQTKAHPRPAAPAAPRAPRPQ